MARRLLFFLVFVSSISSLCVAQVLRSAESFPHSAGSKVVSGDPFDVQTGIYFREYPDLFLPDSIPIQFNRTQRSMDPRSRSFGRGGSTSYDMFIIGDVTKFSWVALVLADGAQERYARVSPGTSYANGVFENSTSLDKFQGSRISWVDRVGWKVSLRDGTEYTVQGCGATSKPGQCAVTEIKNVQGERLSIQRDRDGNILKIVSPHGRFIEITNDPSGRITKAQDDSNHWVIYEYDESGCLVKSRNWRGDSQRFRYDGRFNMAFVHEKGPAAKRTKAYDFTVTNQYDEHDRLKHQVVSSGEVYNAQYIADAEGHIREGDVQGPGGLTKYYFNQNGYMDREQFRPGELSGWNLEIKRDAQSDAVLGFILSCRAAKVRLPESLQGTLLDSGDETNPAISELCARVDRKSRSFLKAPPPQAD